jgi:hypothetical protein
MIRCNQCGAEKEEIEFPFRNKKSGTRRHECILCTKNYRAQYYEQNKSSLLEYAEQYYKENTAPILEKTKLYRDEHKETISDNKKKYYENNKIAIKQYQSENKDKIQVAANKQRRLRRKQDPSFRLRTYISNSVRDALKNIKNSSTWSNLDYSPDGLRLHLEKQFEPWMNWNNHGRYDQTTWNDNDQSTWTWQLDHIIPQSDLPYTSMEDDNFKKCWSLSNLRPLSSKQNIIDGAIRARHQ